MCGITDYTKNLMTELKKIENIEINYLELKPGIFRFNLFKNFLNNGYDIIHIQHEIVMFDGYFGLTSLFIYLYIFALRKKAVTTFHTIKSLSNFKNEIASKYSKNPVVIFIAKEYLKVLFKITSIFSSKILVLSRGGECVLKKEYKIKNVRYIPHGFFNPTVIDDKKIFSVRKKLGFDFDDKIILLFGYPFEKKGYHYVLQAFPQILKSNPEAKIVITGAVGLADPGQCLNYLDRLKKISTELNVNSRVVFTGYIANAEVPCLIALSDMAIFPFEERQTASGSIATVYSYKIPIIVSDIKTFDFLENEIDCVKINIRDNESIIRAAIRLLGDPEFCEELKKNMEKKFKNMSIEKSGKELARLYAEILI
jgi:glycosyltransferase involved in cell wall biosynthesis